MRLAIRCGGGGLVRRSTWRLVGSMPNAPLRLSVWPELIDKGSAEPQVPYRKAETRSKTARAEARRRHSTKRFVQPTIVKSHGSRRADRRAGSPRLNIPGRDHQFVHPCGYLGTRLTVTRPDISDTEYRVTVKLDVVGVNTYDDDDEGPEPRT